MGYVDEKIAQAKAMVGRRIEIPVHYDMWMRGARFGVVSSIGKDGEFIRVKLDHPQAKRRLRVWRLDFDYVKML